MWIKTNKYESVNMDRILVMQIMIEKSEARSVDAILIGQTERDTLILHRGTESECVEALEFILLAHKLEWRLCEIKVSSTVRSQEVRCA